jgi:hypothetical protein
MVPGPCGSGLYFIQVFHQKKTGNEFMLAQEKARERILHLINSKKYAVDKAEILINHSLSGFITPESKEWKLQYYRYTVQEDFLKSLASDKDLAKNFIVLKGMSFGEYNIYENLGERLIADIDLLVTDLEAFSLVLVSQNFTLVKNHVWKGNDYKRVFSKIMNGIEVVVELHTRLFYHSEFLDFKTNTSMSGFQVLQIEDLLVHLTGHLAFQHTFLKLHWLLDIHLLQENCSKDINTDRVTFLVKELKLERSWKMTQAFIAVFFKEERPKNKFEQLIYDNNFLLFPERNKLKYYLIKHLTKDSSLTSFSYDLNWFLQKGWKK